MWPGPDRVIACPSCDGLARHGTLLSGNNCGSHVWTDGYYWAPMLPQPPAVVKCSHCETFFWLADARKVGHFERSARDQEGVDPAWKAARSVKELTEEQYYQALEQGLGEGVERERSLRLLTLWRRNDAHRFPEGFKGSAGSVATGACRRNLEALVALADEKNEKKEEDALLKAEAMRELGNFDSSRRCLDAVTSRELVAIAQQIRELCDAGDVSVRERIDLDATCPECGMPLLTSRARQCRFCRADWH